VTHAELRARLRAYADGTLDESDAEAVRAHLATGCLECLGAVFQSPVGLPRPHAVEVLPRRRGGVRPVMLAAAAAGTGLLVGLMLRGREQPPVVDDAARVELAQLRTDLARLRSEREELEAKANRLEQQIVSDKERLAADTRPEAPPPPPSSPPPEPVPDRTAADPDVVPQWLEDMLAAPETRMTYLEPATFAGGARGYVVWSPPRNLVVVSVSNLPGQDGDAPYRLAVRMRDGSIMWVSELNVTTRGALTMTLALPGAPGRPVAGVDLYRIPPGLAALSARFRR
jgi:hypothetical protein